MGDLIRGRAWEDTNVGPISKWPTNLLNIVSVILSSRYFLASCSLSSSSRQYDTYYNPSVDTTKTSHIACIIYNNYTSCYLVIYSINQIPNDHVLGAKI